MIYSRQLTLKLFIPKLHISIFLLQISEEEILKMASVLGEERKLHGGVKFLDKLPETANGKIDKVNLKKMAKVYAVE